MKATVTNQSQTPEATQKLREMTLYIAQVCEYEPNFGATLLNKILLKADVISYVRTGRPITDARYVCAPKGPVPDGMADIKAQMAADGDIFVAPRPVITHKQMRVIALRDPSLNLFSAADISLVDRVIRMLCPHTANVVSDNTHGRAWKAARPGQEIPYTALAFVSGDPLTDGDIRS